MALGLQDGSREVAAGSSCKGESLPAEVFLRAAAGPAGPGSHLVEALLVPSVAPQISQQQLARGSELKLHGCTTAQDRGNGFL